LTCSSVKAVHEVATPTGIHNLASQRTSICHSTMIILLCSLILFFAKFNQYNTFDFSKALCSALFKYFGLSSGLITLAENHMIFHMMSNIGKVILFLKKEYISPLSFF